MKKFTVVYQHESIAVEAGDQYRLLFPDGKWMVIDKHPDDTQTSPVENPNISYSTAFVWMVESESTGTNWLTHDQLQEIGHLIMKKDQELENR